MRIAIDARMYGNEQCTGIGTYIQRLTDKLFEIDHKNEYVLFLREPEFSRFCPPNDRVNKVVVTPRWYSYGEQFILPFQFLKEKFDLIHYPHFNSPILFPTKSVCTIHDITPLFFPGHKMSSFIRKAGYKVVFNTTLRKAKRIIAISDSTKQGIVQNFDIESEKIEVIYEGVDERFTAPSKSGIINEILQRNGITRPYIFFLGVWRSHKNVETLIKAFELYKKRTGSEVLLVLGGIEDLHYTGIRELISKSKYRRDIITPGYISDKELTSFYRGAEVFVIPSFIEGFGLIAIEAQTCGCPVIASDQSSLPEVLGESAMFFDPNSVEMLCDKIAEVLKSRDLRQSLAEKGRRNVMRFSWENCARKTLAIYENVGLE
jgi:glycosyltransferase involved in cell wall biosynthesis